MGRGVSAGGGQSSLGYLFGAGEASNSPQAAENHVKEPMNVPTQKSPAAPEPVNNSTPSPSDVQDTKKNNYFRADGQNCGNFITARFLSEDRPSTKVHAAPGGGSSLGYLFGDGSK